MLTDDEYQACLRVCGSRRFSSWARRTLLDAIGRQVAERGSLPGGPCYIKACEEPGWCKLKNASPFYYCRAHIEPMVNQFGMEFEDLSPQGEDAARKIILDTKAGVVALTASKRSQDLYEVVCRGLDGLVQLGERQHLVTLTLYTAVRAESLAHPVEPEPEAEECRPLPKGFLDSIEGTGGAE